MTTAEHLKGLHPNWGTVVTIVLFLIVQTASMIWWASSITSDLQSIDRWQVRQDERLDTLEKLVTAQTSTSARTEVQIEALHRDLDRVEGQVEKTLEVLHELRSGILRRQPESAQ